MTTYQYLPAIGYYVQRKCTPEWIIAPQTIDFCDITYISAGKGEYWIDGRSYRVSAGTLLCIPPGSHRRAYTDEDEPLCLYAFNVKLYTPELAPAEPPLPLLSHIEADQRLEYLYGKCTQAWMLKRQTSVLEATSLFLEILARLLRLSGLAGAPTGSPHLSQTSAYIIEHIGEKLTVQALGDALHLHPNYLSRLVRQQTGMPLSRYIAGIRVNAAEDSLLNENISVKEAALRYGFADIYSFSKVFKRLKGYAPSSVRSGER